jgi:hypothetical protein
MDQAKGFRQLPRGSQMLARRSRVVLLKVNSAHGFVTQQGDFSKTPGSGHC